MLFLQVVKLILQGILLIPPDECPDFIYKLMASTWKTDPKDRICFTDIVAAFMTNCDNCRDGLLLDEDVSYRKEESTDGMKEQVKIVIDEPSSSLSNSLSQQYKPEAESSLQDIDGAKGHTCLSKNKDTLEPKASSSNRKKKSNKKQGEVVYTVVTTKNKSQKHHEQHHLKSDQHENDQSRIHDDNQEKKQRILRDQEQVQDVHVKDKETGNPCYSVPLEEDDNNYMVPLELQEVVVHPSQKD